VLSFIDPNLFDAAANFRILPLITASLLFGIAFASMGKEGAAVEAVLSAVDRAIVKVVGWVLWLAPLGIMALIAERIGSEGGGGAALGLAMRIGRYFFSVVSGLAIHGFISLPIILYLLGRENPFSYMAGFARALLTALSTASSSATLPVTISCAEARGLPSRVARFVLPLGATVNMDGTALYEAVAAIFIAQSYGVVLGPGELFIVFVTATAAAVGAAGIPEAGLTTMVLVLTAVGLPVEGIGLILAVDWLLDRARTAVNVWGDAVGAAVVARWEEGKGG
ncbi:MAG: dicarboxylate/amino acid:cation symporter, partial [Candidatus Methanosuratincola sp.]